MFGNDVVTICPFCNKTIYENLGGVSYYNYNVTEHHNHETHIRI